MPIWGDRFRGEAGSEGKFALPQAGQGPNSQPHLTLHSEHAGFKLVPPLRLDALRLPPFRRSGSESNFDPACSQIDSPDCLYLFSVKI